MAAHGLKLLLMLLALGLLGATAASPGAGEAAAVVALATAMGASAQLLASLNQTLFTQDSLCGWQSGAYRCSSLNCGPTTFIICNETGAIIEV